MLLPNQSSEEHVQRWLRHSDARQVFDLPLSAINITVYDLGRVADPSKKEGCQRQVEDLPRISVAEPSDR
jgi:hypothetical protein